MGRKDRKARLLFRKNVQKVGKALEPLNIEDLRQEPASTLFGDQRVALVEVDRFRVKFPLGERNSRGIHDGDLNARMREILLRKRLKASVPRCPDHGIGDIESERLPSRDCRTS